MIRKWDSTLAEMIEKDEDAVSETPKNMVRYAFELRKDVFTNDRTAPQSMITIHSSNLRDLLRTLLKHYPGHTYIGDTISIDSPYKSLIANWDRLHEEAEKTDGDDECQQTRSDLKTILEVLSRGSGDKRLDQYL